ncbi:hypothetical protein DYB37_002623 [Aphanomyces astaci]|uniref:ACT domain-containing protein n=1 Tax=Aphanomyces astaci TaxID=112090 RepID=A0A3R7BJC6_APHAT|nr:hypothetical protein DYB35_002978 [Aphanomyces astaci]RHZ03480.1 hypothetical protein DYB37_002623 [Aphanomyces astaci]
MTSVPPPPTPPQLQPDGVSKLEDDNHLQLHDVRFRSHPDVFDVDVVSTQGALPMTISLESHRTKGRWSCHVIDLKVHASKDAHTHTDGWTVVSALQHHVASGAMHVLLVVAGHDVDTVLPLGFHFELVPFATVSSADTLDSKMLELIKDMDRVLKVPEPVLFLLSQGIPKPLGTFVFSCWNVHQSLEPQHFALSVDATELVFLKHGGYHIQIRGLSGHPPASPPPLGAGSLLTASTFELFVDQSKVAMSQGYGNFCQLSYVFTVDKVTAVSVVIRGYHEHHKSVTLVVEQVPSFLHRARFSTKEGREEERFFSLLVVNRPGTLAQIAQAFAALHTNVGSLSVQPTVVPELSRMTISASVNEHTTARILRRLRRMVCVTFHHVTTMHQCLVDDACVLQSQLLLRLNVPPYHMTAVAALLAKHNGHVIDDSHNGTDVVPSSSSEVAIEHSSTKTTPLSATIVHAVNAPHVLNTLVHRLTLLHGVRILDCHTAAPCFLDISSQVTLQPKPLHPATTTATRPTYSNSRRKLHDRIAAQLFFPQHVPSQLAQPKFILLLGIPGAGKSSILSELDQSERIVLNDFVNFDVDDVIALLPEFYKAMLNIGLGNVQAQAPTDPHTRYLQCQEEAKFILDANLKQATADRRNVILHGSGRSLDKYELLLRSLDHRYEVHVMCVDIPRTNSSRVLVRELGCDPWGLTIKYLYNSWMVHQVASGSPAFMAGLTVGTIIEGVFDGSNVCDPVDVVGVLDAFQGRVVCVNVNQPYQSTNHWRERLAVSSSYLRHRDEFTASHGVHDKAASRLLDWDKRHRWRLDEIMHVKPPNLAKRPDGDPRVTLEDVFQLCLQQPSITSKE